MGNANCCKRGEPFIPGEVLDRVIAEKSEDDKCQLYELANYRKSGILVTAFNDGGSKGLEAIIKSQLGPMMYNHGRGEFITRTEYLRWKFRTNTKITVGGEEKHSKYDPLFLWEDHEACWKMQFRGSLGESLLHILIICDTLVHTRIARILLKIFPRAAIDKIEGEEFLGATALHLAIAYGNDEIAQEIVAVSNEKAISMLVSTVARGVFFLPRDQQHDRPSKTTNYEGLAYLGGYALAWAACLGNETIYNILLEKGADPDAEDGFGNTVLHMVVVTNQMGMFGYALRHPIKSGNQYLENKAGLTCLTLACFLGRDVLFKEMLELSCKEFWRYSNICCSAYPLGALDSIKPSGQTNWSSAIMIILAGTKEEHLNMLEGGIIAKLLDEKWNTFAKMSFFKRLAKVLVQLICISVAIYARPDKDSSLNNGIKEETSVDSADITRYCFEVATLIGAVEFLFIQQGEEIKNSGIRSFLKNLLSNVPKITVFVANILMLMCIPLRFAQLLDTEDALIDDDDDPYSGCWKSYSENHSPEEDHTTAGLLGSTLEPNFVTKMLTTARSGGGKAKVGGGGGGDDDEDEHPGAFLPCNYRQWEELLLIWAIPMTWFYLIFFAGAIKLTGPFVTMIFSMITGDMFTFSMIYIIFLFGFSQSFYFLQYNIENADLYGDYHSTYVGLFQMTLGEYEYEKIKQSDYPGMAKLMFVLFQVLIPILLLNMLIAMMGNTYAIVNEKSDKEFLKQWANVIMSLERTVPPNKAKDYLEAYSIKLSATERGVMVIKKKDKTRASQRKGALSNWKKTGKTIIKYLKKRKMTGDDLRREMWVHDVAETPKKGKKKKGKGYDVSMIQSQLNSQFGEAPGLSANDAMQKLAGLSAMAGPNQGMLPYGIGADPHCKGKLPKKSREEIRQELFLKNRSRKASNKKSRLPKHNEVEEEVGHGMDFMDQYGIQLFGDSSDDDETYLVSNPRKIKATSMPMENGGVVNHGFDQDPPEYKLITETKEEKKEKKKKKKKESSKDELEMSPPKEKDEEAPEANGHAEPVGDAVEEEEKEEKKKKKKKKKKEKSDEKSESGDDAA